MQYTSLGRSGLQVSRLALGTMNFGELTGEAAAFQIMDVDGGPQSPDMEKWFGTSITSEGRAITAFGGCRPIISTCTRCTTSIGALHSLDLSLSDEITRRLDEIWPGLAARRRKPYAW